jgi:hypothetical protein
MLKQREDAQGEMGIDVVNKTIERDSSLGILPTFRRALAEGTAKRKPKEKSRGLGQGEIKGKTVEIGKKTIPTCFLRRARRNGVAPGLFGGGGAGVNERSGAAGRAVFAPYIVQGVLRAEVLVMPETGLEGGNRLVGWFAVRSHEG